MDTTNEKSHSTPKEERRQSTSRHLNLTRLPTLQETLDRRTRPPLDLFCFYVCPISSIMMSFRLGVNALMADLSTKGISGGCTGFLARCPAAWEHVQGVFQSEWSQIGIMQQTDGAGRTEIRSYNRWGMAFFRWTRSNEWITFLTAPRFTLSTT